MSSLPILAFFEVRVVMESVCLVTQVFLAVARADVWKFRLRFAAVPGP
jgi:hypothetical protein